MNPVGEWRVWREGRWLWGWCAQTEPGSVTHGQRLTRRAAERAARRKAKHAKQVGEMLRSCD